ncbi:hypothetical protein CYJ79_07435 [Lactobacillus crispatus]|uniref:Homocysteine S-methyltransferase n=2 Tax=Lactobacillus crispatus TaxID=47770 RepID=A0A2N5KXL8_9LACO|nr:hypothetical protein F1B94_08340 [Lactobacillus crispatus]KAA8788577.1 hypothetical protein F1B98_08335 [Lactobacillus crispatus]PLT10990.1 hypothetical protein CYJ79_07435 [Lactobacillus crispatus]
MKKMGLLEQIKNRGLVLDGAMSYELEKQGVDNNNKLWTATALIDQLSKVYQAHWDWLIFIKMAGSPTAGVEYLQQC